MPAKINTSNNFITPTYGEDDLAGLESGTLLRDADDDLFIVDTMGSLVRVYEDGGIYATNPIVSYPLTIAEPGLVVSFQNEA